MNKPLSFQHGVRDGVPIALGYFPISMTFGMLASTYGFPAWYSILISMTSLTGTGQFMGIDLIAHSAALLEITFTILLINIRYFLMSLSLLQKLPSDISMRKKLLIAFGVTDENYAIAMQQRKPLTFSYLMGILFISFAGWSTGTAFGAIVTDFLPTSFLSAFGIAIYGMFLAIIIPASMEHKAILVLVVASTILSCVAKVIPVIRDLGSGWILIICGITTSAIGAYIAPCHTLDEQETEELSE